MGVSEPLRRNYGHYAVNVMHRNRQFTALPVCDTAVVCNKAGTCHNVAVLEPVVHAGLRLFDPEDRMYNPRLFHKLTKMLGVVPTIE